jgi:hypothetical protein
MIGHILLRICFLTHFTEGKRAGRMGVAGSRGRRRIQLPVDLKENRRYWKLKKEAVGHSVWRTGCGRGYGFVLRRTAERTK